jgi:hypothetical protein
MTATDVVVVAKLRLPDGREFEVRQDHPRESRDGIRYYWTEGNNCCDCNKTLLIDRQHGTDLDTGTCGDTIELVSLTVDGEDALAPGYNDGDW